MPFVHQVITDKLQNENRTAYDRRQLIDRYSTISV